MTEADDLDRALADLARDVAELLRFEHDAGAIGVVALEALRPVAQTALAPAGAARAEQDAAPSRPVSAAPKPAPPKPAAKAAAARPVEVSIGEIDALLAQAKRARAAPPPAPEAVALPSNTPPPTPASHALVGEDGRLAVLGQLARDAASCTACRLHESRTKSVFSRGSALAEVVFVGEGPGFNEDKKGEPFVGAAGQLLDKMIGAMGLARDAVYICNVVKCRPPENRTPLPDEAAACASFLDGQLRAIAPKIIVALGRCAAERLGCAEAGRSWRGSWGEYRGVPVMPTYHPAFLLRNAEMKRPVWEDLQKVTGRLTSLRGGGA